MSQKRVQKIRVIDANKGAWYDEAIGLKFNVTTDEVLFPEYYIAQINPFHDVTNKGPDMVWAFLKHHCIVIG